MGGWGVGHSTCEMLVPSVPTRNSKQDRHHQGQYMYYYEGGSGQPARATCTRPLQLALSAVVGNKSPKDRVVHHFWPPATKTAAADIRIKATRHSHDTAASHATAMRQSRCIFSSSGSVRELKVTPRVERCQGNTRVKDRACFKSCGVTRCCSQSQRRPTSRIARGSSRLGNGET